jgi:hypothetical protein
MGYDSSKFNLNSQGIAQNQRWVYEDTGGESVAGYSAAGFFADAKAKGVDTGDVVEIRDVAGAKLYQGYMHTVQDTGATTGSWKRDTG